MEIETYISIITLNVNRLNALTKRHILFEWIQKQDLYTCCLQEKHFRLRDICRLRMRGWKMMFDANENLKKASSNTHIDKVDFKAVRRDKEGHYIMINGSIQEENMTINMEAPKHIRLIVTIIKGEIDSKTVIVWDINTPPAPIDRLFRQKNKETETLNDPIDQIDLIDNYRMFHLKAAECTFFSSA